MEQNGIGLEGKEIEQRRVEWVEEKIDQGWRQQKRGEEKRREERRGEESSQVVDGGRD